MALRRKLVPVFFAVIEHLINLDANPAKSMNCNIDKAKVHKDGLLEMVKLAGGLDKLGLNGFLAHLINV